MVQELIRRISEKLRQSLPVESTHSTYQDVEQDAFFVYVRVAFFNAGITHGVQVLMQPLLDVIDSLIFKNGESIDTIPAASPISGLGTCTADLFSEEVLQSLLVILRLLNDIIEVTWQFHEKDKVPQVREFAICIEALDSFNTKYPIGFSTEREFMHSVPPPPLDVKTASSLIKIAVMFKSNASIIKILRQVADQFYRSSNVAGRGVALDDLRLDYPVSSSSSTVGMIGVNAEVLLRFISAANGPEYQNFLNTKVLNPLLVTQVQNESDVAQYLDCFSIFFITGENIATYLEIASKLLLKFKKTAFLEALLIFISKAVSMWIISRPKEYLAVVDAIRYKPEDPLSQKITKEATTLFDEVYTTFNVPSMLTKPPGQGSAASSPGTPSSSTVSGPGETSLKGHSVGPILAQNSSTMSLRSTDLGHKHTTGDTSEFFTFLSFSSNMDETTNVTNVAALCFLSCIILLHPNALDEVNTTSFKHFPDEPVDYEESNKEESASNLHATNSGPNSLTSEDQKAKSQHHRLRSLRKLASIPVLSSGHHRNKFLTILLKNIAGLNNLSDSSIIDTLRALILISKLSASCFKYEKDTPASYFSRRIFPVICDCLQICSGTVPKKNASIAKCLAKYRLCQTKLQVDYFPVACSLDPENFYLKLKQYLEYNNHGLEHVKMVTDGLRVFFTFIKDEKAKYDILTRANELLRKSAGEVADVMIKCSPELDNRMSELITNLVSGHIVDDIDENQTEELDSPMIAFFNFFVSTESPAALSDPLPQPPSIPRRPEKVQFTSQRITRTESETQTGWRPQESKLTPAINTKKASSMTLGDAERIHSSFRSTIDRGIRSPSRLTARLRRESQELVNPQPPSNPPTPVELIDPIQQDMLSLQHARDILVNIYKIYKDLIHCLIDVLVSSDTRPLLSNAFEDLVKPVFVSIIEDYTKAHKVMLSYCDIVVSYVNQLQESESSYPYLTVVYTCVGYFITLLSTTLFNLSLDSKKRERLFSYVISYWEFRLGVAKRFESAGKLDQLKEDDKLTFPLIRGSTGRALYASSYSHEPNIHKLLKAGFKLFSKELQFHEKISGDKDFLLRSNKEFIDAMCRESYVATGALAFQRRLRTDILSYIKYPDRVLYDSLRVIYDRWYILSKETKLDQSELHHFRNYAGFIATSCGVFLTNDTDLLAMFPYLRNVRSGIIKRINYFIHKQCQLINNEDLLTRENSKDILGTELHPLAFSTLFKHLKGKINDLNSVDIAAPENELSFVLLEQIILILRVIMERDDGSDTLICVSLDLIELLDNIFKIIEQFPHDAPKYYKSVIQLSKMLRSLEHSEESICISGYMLIKNRWLKLVMQWFESTIFKDYDMENLGKPHRSMDLQRRDLDYLYIDTSIESSKALAYLTKDLVLEAPQSMSERELSRSKEVVFGNYFNILLKGLEKSTAIKKFPPTLRHKIGLLNDNIITSLTNLLNYNVDVGFKYALPIGYSPNRNIKLAFLKVFVNIVSNFDLSKETLKQQRNDAIEKLAMRAIEDPQLISKAARICQANDIDALAGSLVSIYNTKNVAHLIVIGLIKDEISRANRYMDVLRRNSCATRSLSIFSRMKGGTYLVNVLKPVLDEIVATGETFDVEKIQPTDEDCELNVRLFCKYITKLIDSIVSSVDSFPPEFFLICQTIYSSVKEKFPDYAEIAVGSFIFLRFFCPSLVSPESEGITDTYNPKARRSFMILAKVVQNIANGSVSSLKWPALQTETALLKEINDRIFLFLKDISDPKHEAVIELKPNNKVTMDEFHLLHKFLYYHGLDIRREFINDIKNVKDLNKLKESCTFTDKLLSLLGQPRMEFKNSVPIYITEHMETNPELFEFMSRQSLKNINMEDTPFIRETVSPNGFPIMVFTWVLCDRVTFTDVESITYRIFQVYSKLWTTKHYCVVDCTGFDTKRYKDSYVKRIVSSFYKLLPAEAAKNCAAFYYHNITGKYLDLWLPLYKSIGGFVISYATPHHFINSNASLKSIKMLSLSEVSLGIYSDVRVTLHDVSIYDQEKKRFTPITLKIGNKHFQMVHDTPRRVKMPCSEDLVDVYLNDVFDIADIRSTAFTDDVGVPNEFTIYMEDDRRLTLCSSKYLEILKIFHYAQIRLDEDFREDESSSNYVVHSESNNEKDINYIIGQILMVVFVGLNSDDEAVEAVAYNLLAATQSTFKLDCGNILTPSPEVYIPGDDPAFYDSILNGLVVTAPELTKGIWIYSLDLLENVLNEKQIPSLLLAISRWTKNIYEHVYLVDDDEGPEVTSQIIRRLMLITARHELHSLLYAQFIWTNLILDGNLTELIFNEVLHHCVDRESEGSGWKKVLFILTRIPTAEVCGLVVSKIRTLCNSFLPSLKLEVSTHSWSELIILVDIAVSLFFDSLLLSQTYLAEVLCFVSLLIDVGPTELRSTLHRLLMNVCQSLAKNDLLPNENKKCIAKVSNIFSKQKLKFMFGFSQDKGRVLQNFSASSFLTKFTTLEFFINNMLALMENASLTNAVFWKTKYVKYIVDVVTNVESFLSSRAIMIMGIVSKTGIDDPLCNKFFRQTMKIMAVPIISEELVFNAISHVFAYTKIVEGLNSSSVLLPQLFWLSTAFLNAPNTMLYQGSLILMVNCAQQITPEVLSAEGFDSLFGYLFKKRDFAPDLLAELETTLNMTVTEKTLDNLLIFYISKGLLIPFVRSTAIDALIVFFKLTYNEYLLTGSKRFFSFMLLIYMVLRSDHYEKLIEETNMETELVYLDDVTKINKCLLTWLSNEADAASVALYQCAIYFASHTADEPSKVRFLLLLKYLSSNHPSLVYNVYPIVREELGRLNTPVPGPAISISFYVIRLMMVQKEYVNLEDISIGIEKYLESRGLSGVINLEPQPAINDINSLNEEQIEAFHKRKMQVAKILDRMIHP